MQIYLVIRNINIIFAFMDRERQKTHFIYKGIEYKKSGNSRYDKYMSRITHKGKEMTLSVEEFETIISQNCVYCGTSDNITIDRVDSAIGYTPENSVPCCLRCNLMKHTLDKDIFLAHIKSIYEYLNQ